MLLWLWCWLAAAAPIRPLTWEPPYAMGVALKKEKKNTSLGISLKKNISLAWYANAPCMEYYSCS